MNISFVVPMYNSEKTIDICLKSICSVMSNKDEIVVVDNGSSDRSIEIVKKYEKVGLYIYPDITIGALRNIGAAKATGDVLAFIDSDCLLSDGWKYAVIDVLGNSAVGATGSKVDLPDNTAWIERAWYSQKATSCRSVQYINSGNFVVRRRIFNSLGGFSEKLITGEDSELGWRICKAGYILIDNPEVRVLHLGNPKTLRKFYEKEKWHALGMMGTVRLSWIDKPFIMTICFIICNFIAFLNIVAIHYVRHNYNLMIMSFVLVFVVPILAVFYRAVQYNKATKYSLQLFILYWIYFIARSTVVLLMIKGKISKLLHYCMKCSSNLNK